VALQYSAFFTHAQDTKLQQNFAALRAPRVRQCTHAPKFTHSHWREPESSNAKMAATALDVCKLLSISNSSLGAMPQPSVRKDWSTNSDDIFLSQEQVR
jgi:hypothetical protein